MIPFRTNTGRQIDLDDPGGAEISLTDIACGLARLCRFTGQVRQFYSVAQHSVLVANLVGDPRLRRAALLHDASEAYLGDVSRNLKHSPYLAGYRNLEARWEVAIERAFNLRLSVADERQIKQADDLAAIFERTVLREQRPWRLAEIDAALADGWVRGERNEFVTLAGRLPVVLEPMLPITAEIEFLRAYWEAA